MSNNKVLNKSRGVSYLGISVVIFGFLSFSCHRIKTATPSPVSAANNSTQSIGQSDWSWKTAAGGRKSFDEVRETIKGTMEAQGIVGVSLALKQGTIWYQRPKSFLLDLGTENPESGKKIDGSTVFRGGNLSEPIVAYIVLKLASLGTIDIDRPLSAYIAKTSLMDSDWNDLLKDPLSKRLTARRILSHQSGLAFSRIGDPDHRLRFESSPGKSFRYSKDAYPLLYPILERITDRKLKELAEAMVFDPIGMPNSSFGFESRFEGHIAFIDQNEPVEQNAFFTTAADFTKFTWLLTITGLDLSREYATAYCGFAESAVQAPSMINTSISDNRAIIPKGLSWFLGWGRYELPRVSLGNCFFMGETNEGRESYSTAFLSQNSTVLTIFLAGIKRETCMPRIIKEILGDIETPLAWMGFENPSVIR